MCLVRASVIYFDVDVPLRFGHWSRDPSSDLLDPDLGTRMSVRVWILELLTPSAILDCLHPRRSKFFFNFSSATRAYAWGWTRDSAALFGLNKRRSLPSEVSFLISFDLVAPFAPRIADRATTTEQASEASLALIAFFVVDFVWLAFTVVWALGKSFGSTLSL